MEDVEVRPLCFPLFLLYHTPFGAVNCQCLPCRTRQPLIGPFSSARGRRAANLRSSPLASAWQTHTHFFSLSHTHTQCGKGRIVKVTGVQAKGRTATVLLRGSNRMVLDEADRSLHDALCCIRCLVQARVWWGLWGEGGPAECTRFGRRMARVGRGGVAPLITKIRWLCRHHAWH